MSKGTHEVNTISWLDNMRTVVWTMWNEIRSPAVYLVRLWMISMYAAFVKLPVTGSLVGSSSHVKDTVSLSKCSTSRLR